MWANNIPNGIGVRKWPNGDVFEGAFIMGQINGRGTYRWANGSTCSANFQDGKPVIPNIPGITWKNGKPQASMCCTIC
jgi:hypothetical protein